MDARQLKTVLSMDFRPADLGDTPEQFAARLDYLTEQALARTEATPAQQQAGVRYLLLSAQLRQLTRQADRLRAASGSEIQRSTGAALAEVRLQRDEALAESGLKPTDECDHGHTHIVDIGTVF